MRLNASPSRLLNQIANLSISHSSPNSSRNSGPAETKASVSDIGPVYDASRHGWEGIHCAGMDTPAGLDSAHLTRPLSTSLIRLHPLMASARSNSSLSISIAWLMPDSLHTNTHAREPLPLTPTLAINDVTLMYTNAVCVLFV